MTRIVPDHDTAGPAAGQPVLLVHAGVCDRRMWRPQLAALAEAGHRLLLPDLRGYGGTPATAGPYRDADDLLALLDAHGVRRTAVVGASFGGTVALELAARHPDRVTALALLAASPPDLEPGPELTAFIEREDALLEAGDLAAATELNVATWLGPEATEEVRAEVRAMQRHAFELDRAAEEAAEHGGDEHGGDEHGGEEDGGDEGGGDEGPEPAVDLAAVTARTLAVAGAHDLPDFRRAAAEYPARLTGAAGVRYAELPWAGHLPSLERPDETTRLLLDFLAGPAG